MLLPINDQKLVSLLESFDNVPFHHQAFFSFHQLINHIWKHHVFEIGNCTWPASPIFSCIFLVYWAAVCFRVSVWWSWAISTSMWACCCGAAAWCGWPSRAFVQPMCPCWWWPSPWLPDCCCQKNLNIEVNTQSLFYDECSFLDKWRILDIGICF